MKISINQFVLLCIIVFPVLVGVPLLADKLITKLVQEVKQKKERKEVCMIL
jgi:hypothetical protein